MQAISVHERSIRRKYRLVVREVLDERMEANSTRLRQNERRVRTDKL